MKFTVTENDLYPLSLNETDPVKAVRQNVALTLSTFRGSVPLYREFGLSPEALDKPVNVARTMLVADIRECVEAFEPRATVTDVRFEVDKDHPEKLMPVVEVEINE